jgi:hypothetical protein
MFGHIISWQTGANFIKRYAATQITMPVNDLVNKRQKLKRWRLVDNTLTFYFEPRRPQRPKPTGGFGVF